MGSQLGYKYQLFIAASLISTLAQASPPQAPLAARNLIQIQFEVSDQEKFANLVEANKHHILSGDKMKFQPPLVSINGSSFVRADEVETRGQSCLKKDRTCFNLKTVEKVSLRGTDRLAGQRFNLVSMVSDIGYLSSRVGYKATRVVGLPTVKTEFSELQTSFGSPSAFQTQGIYLVTEAPAKVLEDEIKSPAVIRRRYRGKPELKAAVKATEKQYLAAYEEIYTAVKNKSLKGEDLFRAINQRIDLDGYFRWLALNSLFRNGDYSDEVLFYADPTKSEARYKIMPWDYDDLFKPMHHLPIIGSFSGCSGDIKKTILYNDEDKLDCRIAQDPYLYEQFKKTARDVYSRQLTVAAIHKIIDETVSELSPYLTPELLALSRLDDSDSESQKVIKIPYTKQSIEQLAQLRKQELAARHAELLAKVSN